MKKQTINDVYVSEFNNGLDIWVIADKHNDTYKNVYESITGHRFEARLLPLEEKKRICDLYSNNISTVALGKMYGVNNKPIAAVLKEFSISRTGVGRRKYPLNEYFFDDIDTQNKAYILGFLYADGSISRKKSTIAMSLEENDGYILERMRKEIESDRPLEYLDYTNKHDFGYTYKNQYRLCMFSSHMCDMLISKGVCENKSLKLTFPAWMDSSLFSHFVRGYFDGDGSYCPHINNHGKFQPLITITSTDSFCTDLQHMLREILGIPCGNIYDASCHNGITKVLSFSGAVQVKTFLDWLYKDADMYLMRKYDKYISSFYANDSLLA